MTWFFAHAREGAAPASVVLGETTVCEGLLLFCDDAGELRSLLRERAGAASIEQGEIAVREGVAVFSRAEAEGYR
nr:MAG: hypothetical protein DIU78_06100 [Pseudomonadota bacterium]